MRARFVTLTGIVAVAIAVVCVRAISLAGQTQARAASATTPSTSFRTPEGYPDLQGLWNAATLTPLERPNPSKPVLSDEEAAAVEKSEQARIARAARPSKGDRSAPPVGGDGSTGAAGNVGGYNNFWIDRGTSLSQVDGQRRTSIIVDPANGRVPPVRPEAGRSAGRAAAPTSDAPESAVTEARGAYDNPEQRPLGERCLMGFGSTSGPPSLPVLYNNFKQIVQTRDYVMILVEMNQIGRAH